MIQRIQTIYLVLIVILSGLLLSGDLILMSNGSGTPFAISFTGLKDTSGEMLQRLWPLTIIIGLVPLLALIAIFLYRKRPLQMRITMIVLLLSVGTIIMGAFYVAMLDKKIDVTIIWKVKALFPLISAILAWLAYRNILKDDMMVKSYDRLR